MRTPSFSLRTWIVINVVVAIIIAVVAAWQRWSYLNSHEYLAALQRARLTAVFERIPSRFGDWEVVNETTDDREWKNWYSTRPMAVARQTYRCNQFGEEVTYFLFAGQNRHVSVVHRPSPTCPMWGETSEHLDNMIHVDLEGKTQATFRGVRVLTRPNSKVQPPFVLLWSFTESGEWDVPEFLRFHYRSAKELYHIQIAVEESGSAADSGNEAQETALRFAEVFLPELNKVLFEK